METWSVSLSVCQSATGDFLRQQNNYFHRRRVYRLHDILFHEASMFENKGPLSIVFLTFAQATASFDN